MQRPKGEEVAYRWHSRVSARVAATTDSTAAKVPFGRRSAVSKDALKERLTRIRLTIATTSEKKASARTSRSGMPER